MKPKAFLFLIGCSLPQRRTEQHDIFLGIGYHVSDCIAAIEQFWPEAQNLHIDCWREISNVDGFSVAVHPRSENRDSGKELSLYFINMGGYLAGAFEEFHHKQLFVATNPTAAIRMAKKSAFYKKYGLKGAVAHVDDKYGVDIDDIFKLEELLNESDKSRYTILVSNTPADRIDTIHLGYIRLHQLKGHQG